MRQPTHVPVFFRPPSWRPSHFLLLVQEKVTKENTPSPPRSPPKPATTQARYGGLLTGHPWPAANARASCACPCGLFPSRACRDREGPGNPKQSKPYVVPAKAGTQRLRSALAPGPLRDAAKGGRIRPRSRG